jgi:hypothetical protein
MKNDTQIGCGHVCDSLRFLFSDRNKRSKNEWTILIASNTDIFAYEINTAKT